MSFFGKSWPAKRHRGEKVRSYEKSRVRTRRLRFEEVEPRQMLDATTLLITEFMASNDTSLADGDGKHADWIEIYNPNANAVNLEGWHLTDNAKKTTKWAFPTATIAANSYMVIFASGEDVQNYVDAGGYYHTNFKLEAAGEYLGLYRPDGTVSCEYSPTFPSQVTDISYGIGYNASSTTLLAEGAAAKILVPTTTNGGSSLGTTWTSASFDDSSWTTGTTNVGSTGSLSAVASTNLKLRLNSTTSATLVTDTSGAGHNGTNVNSSVSWISEQSDTAASPLTRDGVLQFNASENDQVTVAASTDFTSTTSGTISFWMKSSGTTGSGGEGACLFDLRSSRGMSIVQTDTGAIRVRTYQQNNSTAVCDITSVASVSDNQWHLVTVTFNQASGGANAIYIDGVLSKQGTNTAAWAWSLTETIKLGQCSTTTYAKKYNGLLDDFRFYNANLTAAQIASVYQGVDEPVNSSDIGTNVQSQMSGVNSSVYVRSSFNVSDVSALTTLQLKVQYADGFVAWINGQQVASVNAPTSIAYNSAATTTHSSDRSTIVTITVSSGLLQNGANVLAIQGLNNSSSDSNFLISPTLTGVSMTLVRTYFASATPGAANSVGKTDLGPYITDVTNVVDRPLGNSSSQPLTITAKVTQTIAAVSSVVLAYRIMFNAESTLVMHDDGLNGDLIAGDSIYTTLLPTSAVGAGEMLRWRVIATDTRSVQSTGPSYLSSTDSDQYYGTVALDSVSTQLPTYYFFVENYHDPSSDHVYSTVDTDAGARGCFYYNGQLFDNVLITIKGNTTRYLYKRSHHISFNSGHKFTLDDGTEVGSISLNAEYVDPSYIRQYLAMWLYNAAGVGATEDMPVRLQMNGQFWQLAFQVQSAGKSLLEKLGYDPDGAMYSGVGTLTTSHSWAMEKETRTWEDWSDFDTLAAALDTSNTSAARKQALFDMLDLPEVINYLAVARITQEADDVWANMTLYCDTEGDGLWRIIPFDTNLSFGQLYYADSTSTNGVIQATNDANKSHPLYGSSSCLCLSSSAFNRLYDAIIQTPETREMLLRRMRTIMDEFLQAPGTAYADRVIEAKIDEIVAKITQEANMDRAKWGWPPNSGPYGLGTQSFATGISELKTLFLDPRRTELYVTHSVNNTSKTIGITNSSNAGIPNSQLSSMTISIAEVEVSPASGDQDQEYVKLTNSNSTAVDISGWKLSGAIDFTFKAGTVIAAGGSIYVSPNVKAFKLRTSGPTGGESLFVVGGYDGQLSALGETLTLKNADGVAVSTFDVPDTASDAQKYLEITEFDYNPVAPAVGSAYTATDFEFIEIYNASSAVAIDLTGVRLSRDLTQAEGVEFDISSSGVTSLGPNQFIIVAKNPTALATRYNLTGLTVVGAYTYSLSDSADTIRLVDAKNETICKIEYKDKSPWPSTADGTGNSVQRISAYDRNDGSDNWIAATPTPGSLIPATVASRKIFYNNSKFDSTSDDSAIATDKTALLSGGTATSANVTNYASGINGVIVDITNLANPDGLSASDFQFFVGDSADPTSWTTTVAPKSISVRKGAGTGGSYRVTIIWEDGAIKNEWLKVTVKATAATGLKSADTFYFGNLVGESGNDFAITSSDEDASRTHKTGFTAAAITNAYDYNRDGKVNATDDLIARGNLGETLTLLAAPAAAALAPAPSSSSVTTTASSSSAASTTASTAKIILSAAPTSRFFASGFVIQPVRTPATLAADAFFSQLRERSQSQSVATSVGTTAPAAVSVGDGSATVKKIELARSSALKTTASTPLSLASSSILAATASKLTTSQDYDALRRRLASSLEEKLADESLAVTSSLKFQKIRG